MILSKLSNLSELMVYDLLVEPYMMLIVNDVCCFVVANIIATNEKGLWSGGEFETLLPERPPT